MVRYQVWLQLWAKFWAFQVLCEVISFEEKIKTQVELDWFKKLFKKEIYEVEAGVRLLNSEDEEKLIVSGPFASLLKYEAKVEHMEDYLKKCIYPKWWDHTIKEPFALIDVRYECPEYVTQYQNFHKTMKNYEIVSLHRIQNQRAIEHYIEVLAHWTFWNPSPCPEPRQLYYGVNFENVESLI